MDVRSEGITVVLFKPRGLSHVSFQSILKQKKNAHVLVTKMMDHDRTSQD